MCYNIGGKEMQVTTRDGTMYIGSRDEVIIALRTQERMSYRQIGALVGVSRTTVGTVLGTVGLAGYLYPELRNPDTFRRTDVEIAKDLGVSVVRVASARRKIEGNDRPAERRVSLDRRRRFLSRTIFGTEPGPDFTDKLVELIDELPDKQAEVIREYYLEADGLGSGYSRYYRWYARQELRKIVEAKGETRQRTDSVGGESAGIESVEKGSSDG